MLPKAFPVSMRLYAIRLMSGLGRFRGCKGKSAASRRKPLTEADGLRFYRALAELWLPELKPGGIAAVEIGEGEAAAVCALFETTLADLRVLRDFSGYDRVVSGSRKSCFSAGKHL